MKSGKAMRARRAVEMQPRDWEFLLGIFESRVMTVAQAGEIYFSGRHAMAKKRVGKLKRAGLLLSRPAPVGQPPLLYISRAGLRLLADHALVYAENAAAMGRLVRRAYASGQTLAHESAVMDAVAALHRGSRQSARFSVGCFSTWPRRIALGDAGELRADALVCVEAPGCARDIYIEVDRSTEIRRVIEAKVRAYIEQGPPSACVLFVAESAARRRSIERVARQGARPAPLKFHFATRAELMADPARFISEMLS